MIIDQLKVFNNSLLLVGQRQLDDLVEDREPLQLLNSAWELGAVEYCLELVKPVFASKIKNLSSPSTSAIHDLDSVHTLPDDYITVVGVFADSKLDQPIKRYLIEGLTLVCEYDSVYLRYSSSDHVTDFSAWSNSFINVLSAYLAREISIRLAPDEWEKINNLFVDRVESTTQLEGEKEPEERAVQSTATLSQDWLVIYNDALLVMGLSEIVSVSDDSARRSKLDRALGTGLVEALMEDIGWTFGMSSTKSTYDPSVEPAWGYRRAHQKPPKMERLDGIYQDEHLQRGVKMYQDEGDYFFCDEDVLFIQYVSTDFRITPSAWPMFFRKLVAAQLAYDTVAGLKGDVMGTKEKYEERYSAAKSNDAMASPPRRIQQGSWTGSRHRGHSRGRPGDQY